MAHSPSRDFPERRQDCYNCGMSDFSPTPSTPPPSSGCLPKLIFLLIGASLLVGTGLYFGGGMLKDTVFNMVGSLKKYQPLPTPLPVSQPDPIKLPEGYSFTGRYAELFSSPALRMFVATKENDGVPFPAESLQAMDLNRYLLPVLFIVTPQNPAFDLDLQAQIMFEKIRVQGSTTAIQNKIWIAGKETPAWLVESAIGGRKITSLLLQLPGKKILLASAGKELFEAAPHRQIIADAFQAKPGDVSFMAPKPPVVEKPKKPVLGKKKGKAVKTSKKNKTKKPVRR